MAILRSKNVNSPSTLIEPGRRPAHQRDLSQKMTKNPETLMLLVTILPIHSVLPLSSHVPVVDGVEEESLRRTPDVLVIVFEDATGNDTSVNAKASHYARHK